VSGKSNPDDDNSSPFAVGSVLAKRILAHVVSASNYRIIESGPTSALSTRRFRISRGALAPG